MIGAYPLGETWDICRQAPDAATLEGMKKVAFPASDPVSGRGGALVREWKAVWRPPPPAKKSFFTLLLLTLSYTRDLVQVEPMHVAAFVEDPRLIPSSDLSLWA